MNKKLNTRDSDFETGMKIHFLIEQMSLENLCNGLPLEVRNYIKRFEYRFYTLYWALKKVPKGSAFWGNKSDAYEIIYGPKLKGRKNSSISLEEKVNDYFHVENIRQSGKSLEDSIEEYMKKMNLKADAENKNFNRIQNHYYFIKPKLELFISSIR